MKKVYIILFFLLSGCAQHSNLIAPDVKGTLYPVNSQSEDVKKEKEGKQ